MARRDEKRRKKKLWVTLFLAWLIPATSYIYSLWRIEPKLLVGWVVCLTAVVSSVLVTFVIIWAAGGLRKPPPITTKVLGHCPQTPRHKYSPTTRMDEKPRRHWFRFSLRTLFLLVTLLACAMAWVAYSLNWIRQRWEFVYEKVDPSSTLVFSDTGPTAPGLLWMFGEEGVEFIVLKSTADFEEAHRLFPEVSKVIDPRDWPGDGN